MTERDMEANPYSPDEQRVAQFLFDLGAGGGDDPIGFILVSHATLAAERNALRASGSISITVDELRKLRLLSTRIISWLPSSPQVSELVNLLIEIEDRNIE